MVETLVERYFYQDGRNRVITHGNDPCGRNLPSLINIDSFLWINIITDVLLNTIPLLHVQKNCIRGQLHINESKGKILTKLGKPNNHDNILTNFIEVYRHPLIPKTVSLPNLVKSPTGKKDANKLFITDF